MKKWILGLALGAVCNVVVAVDDDIYTHECTSWMVFHDLTQNRTNLLHKNRDAKPRDLMPLKSPENSPRKWIGLGGSSAKDRVNMGMNDAGLAVVVNSGEATIEPSNAKATMGTTAIIRDCLSECDTAAQAVEKLKEIVKERKYSHGKRRGSIFFFMDRREAYIVEVTAKRCSAMRYDHGYAFRANIWRNPDMASVADNTGTSWWFNGCNRELMVIRDLNKAYRANGKITIADMLEMSRDTLTPEKSPINRPLCFKSTNSAATFEIDLDHPDVLSTGYFLIGPPRHTICAPVPICVAEFHPAMNDLRWSGAAWASFDRNGFGAELPPEWKEFESHALADYKKAQAEARKLLAEGERDAAVKLLNDTAYSIWDGAAKRSRR